MVEIGILLARVVIGLVIAAHGSQKLFGWFGGPGMPGFTKMLDGMSVRPARIWALVAALTEFVGGLMLALGLLTPLVGAALFGNFIVAAVIGHMANGFWNQKGGYEYPMVLSVMALVLAITGAGPFSLDGVLALPIHQPMVVISAMMASLAIAIGVLEARRLATSYRSRRSTG